MALTMGLWLAVLGCTSNDERKAASTRLTSTSSTSTTLRVEDEVLRAYRRFWDIYLAAANPMNPLDPRLSEVATGDTLRQVGGAFLAAKDSHQVLQGTIDLHAGTVEFAGADQATFDDCQDSHIEVYEIEENTGRRTLKEPGGGVKLVAVTMHRDGGVWKVADLRPKREQCDAAG